MAYIAEESGLGEIELDQFLRAFSFLVVCIGVCDARGDLACDEFDESFIGAIELAVRIKRGDEDAHGIFLSLPGDRHEARAGRGPVPASFWKIGKEIEKVFNCHAAIWRNGHAAGVWDGSMTIPAAG